MIVQLIVNGIISGSIYALVALGFALIYGTIRFFHFAHGAIFTLGAYLTYTFYILCGMPLLFACILSIILTSLSGVLIEIIVYRPLRRKGATSLILLIASLGIFVILENVISLLFGNDTRTMRHGMVQEGIYVLGARITPVQLIIIAVSVIFFIITSVVLKWSKVGKALRATANDLELAMVMGINTDRILLFAFFIGSALAAVAAILISFDTDMTPMIGFNALMMGVIAVIIGGVGSIPGAALGALLLGLAQHISIWKVSSKWQDALAFTILLVFLLFKPYGFLGKKIKKVKI